MPFADTSCLAHVALSRYEYEKGIAPHIPRCHSQTLRVLLMSRCRAIKQKQTKNSLGCKHPGSLYLLCFASLVETRKFYLFENFFTLLNALFWAFLGRVAVYLLRTVESSGLLYAAGATLPYDNHFCFIRVVQSGYWMKLVLS